MYFVSQATYEKYYAMCMSEIADDNCIVLDLHYTWSIILWKVSSEMHKE